MVWFSIVIPLFNKRAQIEKALESIQNQTHQQFEVIIVDDGSSDGSKEVVEDWIQRNNKGDAVKYRIISKQNGGVSSARNKGVEESKYDYIALLDADDWWEIGHLSSLKLLIKTYAAQVDIFSTGVKQIHNNQVVYPKLGEYEQFMGVVDFFIVSLISNGFVNSSSVCIKKSAITQPLFPVGMKNYEDVITWARVSSNKGLAFSSDRTCAYAIDHADASLNVDFRSYIQFDDLLKGIPYSGMFKYKASFFFMHFLFCRMNMPLDRYLKSGCQIFGKSAVVSCVFLVSILVPRFVLMRLRNIRKRK